MTTLDGLVSGASPLNGFPMSSRSPDQTRATLAPFSWELESAHERVPTPRPLSPRIASPSPRQPHDHTNAPSPWRHLVLVLHFVSLCLTSRLIRHAAVFPRSSALVLPVGQGACLAALGALAGRLAPGGRTGGKLSVVMRGDERWAAWTVGLLTSSSTLGSVWSARTMDGRQWQAIEVSTTDDINDEIRTS